MRQNESQNNYGNKLVKWELVESVINININRKRNRECLVIERVWIFLNVSTYITLCNFLFDYMDRAANP